MSHANRPEARSDEWSTMGKGSSVDQRGAFPAPTTFEELLPDMPMEEFASRIWTQAFYSAVGDSHRFDNLYGWAQINTLLETQKLVSPRLKLIKNGFPITEDKFIDFYSRDAPQLDATALRRFIKQGASLVLNGVDDTWKPLQLLTAHLQQRFRCRVFGDIYASWGTSKGFTLHWDDHEIFILQLAGRKHWKVYQPTRDYPLVRSSGEPDVPTEDPICDALINPGELLYLPRGWWHVATPIEEPSLHLTIGLRPLGGIELLGWFLERMKGSEILRQDMPRAGSYQSKKQYTQMLATEMESNWDKDILDQFLRAKDGNLHTRVHAALSIAAATRDQK